MKLSKEQIDENQRYLNRDMQEEDNEEEDDEEEEEVVVRRPPVKN